MERRLRGAPRHRKEAPLGRVRNAGWHAPFSVPVPLMELVNFDRGQRAPAAGVGAGLQTATRLFFLSL